MSELIDIARNMGIWVYTLMNAYRIPYLNVTPWTLSISIMFFELCLKAYDKLTHRHQGEDNNNNYVYKEQ